MILPDRFARAIAHVVALSLGLGALLPCAWAFPPYRSTDAETADPRTVEARLGLTMVRLDAGRITWSSPLARLNFGLPHRLEILSEIEVRPLERRVADAAVGLKWAPVASPFGAGIEVLALLPVVRGSGAGVEANALVTVAGGPFRLHLNAGLFHDAREPVAETGWRGGVLGEGRFGRWRPGVELFGKQVLGAGVQLLAGLGLIVALGPIDLRAGLHVGLTRQAPDLTGTVWISGKIRLR